MAEFTKLVHESKSSEETEKDISISNHKPSELLSNVDEIFKEVQDQKKDHTKTIVSGNQNLVKTTNSVNRSETDISMSGAISNYLDSSDIQNLGKVDNNEIVDNTKDTKSGCDDISNKTRKSGTESDSHIIIVSRDNLKDNLFSDCKQNYTKNEEYKNCEERKAVQESDKLSSILYNILVILEKLLRRKMALLLLRKQNLKKEILNSAKDVQLNVHKSLESFSTDTNLFENPKVQGIQNLIESIDVQEPEEETVDLDVIVKETLKAFFEFQDAYEKRKSYLEAFINDIEKRQKFKDISRNIPEQQISFFSNSISRAKSFLYSSDEAFREFQILIQKFMETSAQDIETTMNCLFLTIHFAESSCLDLQSLTCTILSMIV